MAPRKWAFNLTPPSSTEITVSTQRPRALQNPAGLNCILDKTVETTAQRQSNYYAVAMREAGKPFMGILQNGFMMYMSGSHITIWSMMMTSMGIYNPVNQILSVNNYFKRFEDGNTDLTVPKLLFIALNLLSLCVALYKCKSMGLLPITSADWTGYLVEKEYVEYAGSPVPY